MERREISRRTVLQGGAALAGLALLGARAPSLASARHANQAGQANIPWPAQVALDFPSRPGEEVLPWLDQPDPNPAPEAIVRQLAWEALDSWITPIDKFFIIKHYAQPELDPQTWRLEIHGLVERPTTLSLADLQAREHRDVPFTLECSGNHGFPFFTGGIGNAVWTGTPLAPLLEAAGPLPAGSEVVFWGTETGPEEVAGLQVVEQFARSMSLAEALDPRNILCWGMNGEALPAAHGAPVRLIAPGWYGIANVKWLQRIEILDRPYQGRYMAREYRTIRNEERDGQTLARFTSVGRVNLKSAPARVTRLDGHHRVIGVAWGGPVARVEVQIDDGDWQEATIEEQGDTEHTWLVWSLDWGQPSASVHSVTSRAIDSAGNVQPAMDDPWIANKLTYWESNGQITRVVNTGGPIEDIELPGETVFSASLSGGNEAPDPGDADGFGFARLVINAEAQSVCYRISVAGIDPPTAAHIHAGAAGVSGPVVVPLTPVDASGLWNGCVTVDAALAAAIVANSSDYYVNIHTAAYPAGALRGQLEPIV